MVFPVVMYGCEGWAIKKTESWRTDTFKLRCWRRVPWIARRSNQSILKEINPEYSLEGLLLGKIEGNRRRGQQRIRRLDSSTDSMDMNLSKFWKTVEDRGAWQTEAWTSGVAKSQTRLSNWTELNWEEPGILQVHSVTQSDMTEQQHSIKKACLGKLWIKF